MTWNDLLRSSLRLIGQLGPGRGQNQSETTDALMVLNSMLDAWQTESLNIYAIIRRVYDVPAGQTSYSAGCGGDLCCNTRPVKIVKAGRVLSGAACDSSCVDMITWKDYSCGKPGVYYDNQWPCGTVYLRPPLSAGEQLALYMWQPIASVEDIHETVEFPPGYADAIRYNLANRLAPEWGKVPNPWVMRQADVSLGKIKSFHSSPPPVMDGASGIPGGGGAYDICSDSEGCC